MSSLNNGTAYGGVKDFATTDVILEKRDNGRTGGGQNLSKLRDFINRRPLRLHKMVQKITLYMWERSTSITINTGFPCYSRGLRP
jgi:hypothetical protein